MQVKTLLIFCIVLVCASSCKKLPIDASLPQRTVHFPADSVTFAVIGDFGDGSKEEGEVADMVKSWNPEFIITTGDNNYPVGSAGTIVDHIGKYYCDFIYNPDAPASQVCNGKAAQEKINRFFPSPGNHDNYSIPALQPYLDYFTLPGDERNYDFVWGPVHFYSINTGKSALIGSESREARWLQDSASKNTEPFKFAYFHHPPYSVSNHGSATKMRWPFQQWGIHAILTGHEHVYQRITEKNNPSAPPLFVCGTGGNDHLYSCTANPVDRDKFDVLCDNSHHGAMKVRVSRTQAIFEYYGTDNPNQPIDVYIIHK